MTLRDLDSSFAIDEFQSENANTLICFSATWCGPCKASKPTLEALAAEYGADPTVDVAVGIAYEHNLGDSLQHYGVKAFPTYVLWEDNGKKEVGRVAGANFENIRSLVQNSNCVNTFGAGEGQSLGGAAGESQTLSADDVRQQRLARMGAASSSPAKATGEAAATDSGDAKPAAAGEGEGTAAKADEATAATTEASQDVEMEDADETAGSSAPAAAADGEFEMVDPTVDLDKATLEQLTSSMGFSLLRAQKGLLNGGNTAEGAVEWLLAHQDDDDIDDPIPLIPAGGGGVAQSYKCNECGKVLSNMANLELHANKTGHSDFEESTQSVKPLTAEEKAAKVKEIKGLLAAKRQQREEAEKAEEKEREKQRRFMGKEMGKTREQMEREARKRDAKQKKRGKDAFKRERERIRAELAKDKAERAANKGKLSSKLGVDGYNPDAIQYDSKDGEEGGDGQQQPGGAKQAPNKAKSHMKVDDCIKKVSQYRAGGDGGKCLKILHAYVKNVADTDEEKFKTINMENKAFRTKVKPFIGGKQLLLAVGFSPNEGNDALVLSPDAEKSLLSETKKKLEDAMAAYG